MKIYNLTENNMLNIDRDDLVFMNTQGITVDISNIQTVYFRNNKDMIEEEKDVYKFMEPIDVNKGKKNRKFSLVKFNKPVENVNFYADSTADFIEQGTLEYNSLLAALESKEKRPDRVMIKVSRVLKRDNLSAESQKIFDAYKNRS